ncbi:MAG: hypothetical protein P3B98_06750, partial [Gemmatimonadota bacterium]|nr:hypothetical protein [Gemmatimonadota bacterium]
ERIRAEWQSRARARREQAAWPGAVISAVECLIDYWFVQRAAAADVEWAEGQARLENSSLGASLAARDASGTLHFAEALALVCGAPARAADAADAQPAQPEMPTAAETVA